eukprot:g7879.t1
MPEYCTLFNHQSKSAVTAIKEKLATASLEARLSKPGLCLFGRGYENSCLEAMNGTNPVVVGYTELLREVVVDRGRQCDYFTVMRHPIDRLISAFFYCPERNTKHRRKEWCGATEGDVAGTQGYLLEFAKRRWKNKAFRQMSYNIFPPQHTFRERIAPPHSMDQPETAKLVRVVEGILRSYTAVGILEHWDLTMELFNARVKSPVRDWKATPEPLNRVHEVYSDFQQKIHEWARTSPDVHAVLATDLVLYDFALDVFKQQTAESLGTKWTESSSFL